MDAAHGYLQLLIFLALVCRLRRQSAAGAAAHLAAAGAHASTDRRQHDLAGILLKFGTYGILRFCLPMLPDATAMCMPWILWLAVVGIVYGALVSLVQADLKKLIAYSSVSHMGFVILGFFALNPISLQGGILQMINHGFSPAGLFAVVGMIYERYHTRQISELGGLAKRTPLLAVVHADLHVVQHRPAGAEWFCRRIPDSARHVSACLDRCARLDWVRN